MDSADVRFAPEEEWLEQVGDYYWRIIHAADPYKRQLEVVFVDHFLSSTTCPVNFLHIKRVKTNYHGFENKPLF